MVKNKRFSRKLQLADATVFDYGQRRNLNALGSSGTDIIGGRFGEEYLSSLQGRKAADEFDKMRRGEAQVAMLLQAVKNPIKSANITFEGEEGNAVLEKAVELVEWNFCDGLEHGSDQFLTEVLTLIDKGHSVFERIDGVTEHPTLGTINYIKNLAFRKQNSINRWNLERGTGRIASIEQIVYSDTSKDTLVEIPGDYLAVFTNQKEGDNYEGISMLRPMYGAYLRKDLYLKLAAIGIEKYAIGIPIATAPDKKKDPKELEQLKLILDAYIAHESGYIIKPAGWELDVKFGQFDATKIADFIKLENQEMINAAVANFLALGMTGSGGSYSLGSDLSDFFLAGLQAYANVISGTFNRKIIPATVKQNYGPLPQYPKMCISGINDKAGKELAEIVLSLTNATALRPDDKLEDFLRMQYNLPKADTATTRAKSAPVNPNDPNNPQATPPADTSHGSSATPAEDVKPADAEAEKLSAKEKRIILADAYTKNFDKHIDLVKPVMQKNLRIMADSLKSQIAKNWKALGDSTKVNAIKGVSSRGLNDYKNELKAVLATVATQAIEDARKEVPTAAKKVKFAEYDRLNAVIKRLILIQMNLTVETQAADLEKAVFFQFYSSALSQTDLDAVLNDIETRVAPVIEGTAVGAPNVNAAAGNTVSQITQGTRNEFFFEPEVLAEIESFTFFNEDPISEICQNLNGQTFLPTDKDAEQYYPPLHPNCKSRLIPNGKGSGEKVTGLNILAKTTEERQRLEKQITLHECSDTCDHETFHLFT
jgi:hypothetical protein